MTNETAKWTLQHENGTQTTISNRVSLKLAFESGYQWVNKHDGNGWRQLAYILKRN